MKTHAPAQEPAKQKAPAVALSVPQLAAEFTLEDARSEAVALQCLHDIGSYSPRPSQLKSLQAMMNASPRAQTLQTMQAMSHQCATAVTQRHLAD